MVIRALAWIGVVCHVALACGETSEEPGDVVPDAATDAGAGGAHDAAGGSAGGAGNGGADGSAAGGAGGLVIVDSGPSYKDALATDSWCAPPTSGKEVAACCNDSPCEGLCYAAADAAIQCECFGIVGGCKNGTTCCSISFGCVPPGNCPPAGP